MDEVYNIHADHHQLDGGEEMSWALERVEGNLKSSGNWKA